MAQVEARGQQQIGQRSAGIPVLGRSILWGSSNQFPPRRHGATERILREKALVFLRVFVPPWLVLSEVGPALFDRPWRSFLDCSLWKCLFNPKKKPTWLKSPPNGA